MCVTEMMELADEDVLDVMRSRTVEQEVLDSLDEPAAQVKSGWPIWDCRPRPDPLLSCPGTIQIRRVRWWWLCH